MINPSYEVEILDIQTIKDVSTTFAELSAIKMETIRHQLQLNMAFYEDIQKLYTNIRVSSQQKGMLSNINAGTVVSVGLTSNGHFYGSLNNDLVNSFLNGIKRYPTDAIMIGKSGQEILGSRAAQQHIEMINFKSEFPTTREIYDFLNRVKGYEKVFFYHPEFINIMDQEPTISEISYNPSVSEDKNEFFIFEPELSKILEFFETHVRFLLLRRSLLEIELARNAARLVAMMGAEDRAISTLKSRTNRLKQIERGLITDRLLETIRAYPWIKKQISLPR